MIRNAAAMPATPISHHGTPRGCNWRSAEMGLARAWRPMAISATMSGRPMNSVESR